jgi:hypothetical protein
VCIVLLPFTLQVYTKNCCLYVKRYMDLVELVVTVATTFFEHTR